MTLEDRGLCDAGQSVSYRLLGPFEAWDGTRQIALGRSKERALLALLVLNANRLVSTDRLIDELWADTPPTSATTTLRAHVSRLRKALGGAASHLETRASGYVLQAPLADIDSNEFERLLEAGRAALASRNPEEAIDALEAALGLWRGPALSDVGGPASITAEAARLDEARAGTLEHWVEANLAIGRHAQMVSELEHLTLAHPLREHLWELRMLSLYRCGRQADALRAYGELRRVLREELGIEPGAALRQLEVAILNQDPALMGDGPGEGAPRMTAPTPPPLPPGIESDLYRPFVGREHEVDRVRHWWAEASSGHRRLVLLGGEPGIGKSRLAAEFAKTVHAEGAMVLFGRCDEYLSSPYHPFVEALEAYTSGLGPEDLRGELAPDFSPLIPALVAADDVSDAVRGGEAERFRLFGSVTALLDQLAARQGLLLVLEDLQWSDVATGLLLRHLVRHAAQAPLLILGTYRDAELSPQHPLRDVLFDLRRGQMGERLHLGGLSAEDIATLVSHEVGAPLDPAALAFAQSLWRQTDGNPFFVEEVIGDLRAAGGDATPGASWVTDASLTTIGIPEGIKEAIGRRLQRLSPEANMMLPVAAVTGQEFSADTLEHACDLPADAILASLEEAAAAGLVSEVGGHVGVYRFSHALVRETLSGGLSLLRRVRLHGRIGRALEDIYADAIDVHLPELAHHFLRAAAQGDADKAVDYAGRAGDQAMARLAYEDAIGHYQSALEVLEEMPPDRERRRERARLLLLLAEANRRRGETASARARFGEAAALARQLGDGELLACAALGQGLGTGGLPRAASADEQLVALLEEALTALPPGDNALRVAVLARLAEELYYSPESERRFAIADGAVAMAERLADPAVTFEALYSREWCRIGPDVAIEERLRSSAQLVELAHDLGARENEYEALLLREQVLLEHGDFLRATDALERASRLAAELRIPGLQGWVLAARSRRAWLAGEFEEADGLNGEAMSLAMRPGGDAEAAMLVLGGQAMAHQLLRADMGDFVDPLRQFAAQYPQHKTVGCFLSYALAASGQLDEALRALDTIVGDDLASFPRIEAWLLAAWAVARVLAAVDDTTRARRVYDQVLPFDGRWIVSPAAPCLGPVSASLGLLAATAGHHERAATHFECAMADTARVGCRPWRAEAAYWYGAAVVGAPLPDDGIGHRLARIVLGECQALGMTELASRGQRLWPNSR